MSPASEVVITVPGLREAAWAVRRLAGLPPDVLTGLGVVSDLDDRVHVFAVVAADAPGEVTEVVGQVAGEFGRPGPALRELLGRGVKMIASGNEHLILAALARLGKAI